MILETGSKVLVAHRRLFEGDHSRFFTGIVEGYEAGIVRVCGHTWVRDGYKGRLKRKDDERTKILSLSSGTLIFYVLPSVTDLNSLHFTNLGGELVLRDANGTCMDMSESILTGTGQSSTPLGSSAR